MKAGENIVKFFRKQQCETVADRFCSLHSPHKSRDDFQKCCRQLSKPKLTAKTDYESGARKATSSLKGGGVESHLKINGP